MSDRRFLKRFFVFATVFIAAAIPGRISEVSASGITELHHSVYLGGIYMGGVTTTLDEDDSNYRIKFRLDSNDTFKWVFEWIVSGTAEGVKKQGNLTPVLYTHKSMWNDKSRRVKLDYKPDGKVKFKDTGKKKDNPRKYILLDPETVHNSFDPMSAILLVANWLSEGRKCHGEIPVFDGRRRYNLLLSEKPQQIFPSSAYSVFTGAAQGCKVDIEKIGGFKRKISDFEKRRQEYVIWVAAPLDGGPFVPVRMRVETDLGSMELHLDRIKRGASKLVAKNYE